MVLERLLDFRRVVLTSSFIIFLYPISIDGFGVNYSFLLLPLLYISIDLAIYRPANRYLYLVALYVAIFIVASAYQYEFYGEAARRIVSFALFMSTLIYMFIRIDSEMIESFKDAIILVSLLLSASSILVFFVAGGSALDSEVAKNLVGSARVGFIYLVAIWLVYLEHRTVRTSRRFAL